MTRKATNFLRNREVNRIIRIFFGTIFLTWFGFVAYMGITDKQGVSPKPAQNAEEIRQRRLAKVNKIRDLQLSNENNPVKSGNTGNSQTSRASGVYTWEHTGNDDKGSRKEKLDLRDDGTYVWTNDFFYNGVRDDEYSDTWRGRWELKNGNVEVTFSDYKYLTNFSAEDNEKMRRMSEGVHRFKIESNGDLLNTHKDGELLSAEDTQRYKKM